MTQKEKAQLRFQAIINARGLTVEQARQKIKIYQDAKAQAITPGCGCGCGGENVSTLDYYQGECIVKELHQKGL